MTDHEAPQSADAQRIVSVLRLARAVKRGDSAAATASALDVVEHGGDLLDIYETATAVVHGLAPGSTGEDARRVEVRAVAAVRDVVESISLAPRRNRDVDVVVAVAATERHTLGALMVANLLRRDGYRVAHIHDGGWGALGEVIALQPQLAAVCISAHGADTDTLREGISVVRELRPETAVLAGGWAVMRSAMHERMGADAVLTNARDALVVLRRLTSPLSDRETEVLQAIADGKETDEVAQLLGVQSSTVREHVQRSFAKLSARTRASAVAEALRRGLID